MIHNGSKVILNNVNSPEAGAEPVMATDKYLDRNQAGQSVPNGIGAYEKITSTDMIVVGDAPGFIPLPDSDTVDLTLHYLIEVKIKDQQESYYLGYTIKFKGIVDAGKFKPMGHDTSCFTRPITWLKDRRPAPDSTKP
jgi:hypothetical protein